MRKLYTLLLFVPLFNVAQLSLTQFVNEPVIGNVDYRKNFDTASSASLPRNPGANQLWDFSAITANTVNAVATTYTTPSSISSSFTAATIGSSNGATNTFYKSSSNLYEMVGLTTSTMALTFTNYGTIANWPIAYTYTNTDAIAGNVASGFGNGTFTGNIITKASGTGTVQLPNAMSYSNCLQVTATVNINAIVTVSMVPIPVDFQIITYQYYHSSQKFPVVTITETGFDSPLGSNTTTVVDVNDLIFAGITEMAYDDNSFSLYPNPANEQVTIHMSNPNSENAGVVIINSLGMTVKKAELGNSREIDSSVNTSQLAPGVYYVKTILGTRSSVKKLIIN